MSASQKRLKVREDRKNGNTKKLSIGDVTSGVLNGIGAASDYVDKSVGIAGTPVNVYNGRKLLKNSILNITGQKDNKYADLGLEFLIPDSSDLLGGAGYIKRGTDLTQALRLLKKTDPSSLKIAKAGVKDIVDGPPKPPPAFAGLTIGEAFKNGAKNGVENGVENGEKILNGSKPLQIASNMQPAGWQGSIKTMLKENVPASNIAKKITRPYHKDLKKTYRYMSVDDLAKDKGGWLSLLVDRADTISGELARYNKLKSQGVKSGKLGNVQRELYDNVSFNPLTSQKQIYDKTNPIRKVITKTFNEVAGKEWHHIFGNKDAAEAMLSQVAQDPYIAVNLLHHLKRLKLPTSGTAENIALIGKKAHRGAGTGYHTYSKKLGLESKGKKEGVLEFSTYARAIAENIANGKGDINQLFEIFTSYKKLNVHQRALLKEKYNAQVISEMKPVMKFIQGA
tara:strand:+ start:181 stop:1539 length:1359 start_codon:yes stop_codon:yes gene_type:complete